MKNDKNNPEIVTDLDEFFAWLDKKHKIHPSTELFISLSEEDVSLDINFEYDDKNKYNDATIDDFFKKEKRRH